ncbi:MAG TPA: hypothetical protein VM029_12885 [Opitutaceae bacterium]|nr:hypothetical protein [Opitutaceae bacterium]
MTTFIRALLLALMMLPAAVAAEETAVLPAIFAPLEERRSSVGKPTDEKPGRPTLVSDHMRSLLTQKIAALPVTVAAAPTDPLLAEYPVGEPLMMYRYVVNEKPVDPSALKRDESLVWRYLRTGKLYSYVGRKVDFDITLTPLFLATGGLQPREITRFELAFHLRW